jgi:mRNA interferase MazF
VVIRQGDIFWAVLGPPRDSEPGYTRPVLVIQNNRRNKSKLNTVLVCTLTRTLSRANDPGNVLLRPGEGGLPEQSVVNVSQVFTVSKEDLQEKVGCLNTERMHQVLEGLHFHFLVPRDVD